MSTGATRPPGLKLSVLDFVQSLPETIELAIAADRLGFSRYWLTEHQPQPNPQMIAGLLAGVTDTIRLGTAGILLRFHNPLMAAQNFWLLEMVYPGRIDAGFCAGKADELLAEALLDGHADSCRDSAGFAARAELLIGFLRREFPVDHRYASLPHWQQMEGTPQIWSFGTGESSAILAARQGTALGYSLFHQFSRDTTATIDQYRSEFRPRAELPQPLCALAVAGVCAPTESRARQILAEHRNPFIVPTIGGTPEQCREQLEELRARYQTDELVFLDVCQAYQDRLATYELLAEVCELRPSSASNAHLGSLAIPPADLAVAMTGQ